MEDAIADEKPRIRGTGAEPVKLEPGAAVREAARDAELERWAWKRIAALRAFYTHLSIYALVNFLLLVVDMATPGGPWFFFPLLGWGLGLGMHAAQAYELLPWFTRDWEQRKVKEMMEGRERR